MNKPSSRPPSPRAFLVRRRTLAAFALLALAAIPHPQASPATAAHAGEDAAQNPPATAATKKSIALLLPDDQNPFYLAIHAAAEAKAEKTGYSVFILHHGDDTARQSKSLEEARRLGATAVILLACADSPESVEAIRNCRDAGVPVLLLDRQIAENGLAIAQITANNYRSAQLVAHFFAGRLREGEYVVVAGPEDARNSAVRERGFLNVLDSHPALKRLAVINVDWSREQARDLVSRALADNPGLKGAICANDAMALGAHEAFRAAGRAAGAVVVGFDGTDAVRDSILAGEIAATLLQPITRMTEAAVEQIHEFLQTGRIERPERQEEEGRLVTRANAKRLQRFALLAAEAE